jgi:phosphotransferase system enzyme I (PtsI)
MQTRQKEIFFRGTPICRGIAIGRPFIFKVVEDNVPEFTIALDDIEVEIQRFYQAVNRAQEDVKRLKRQLEQERIVEGAAILDTHLQMMEDSFLLLEVENQIRETRINAECVFQNVIKSYQKHFGSMADPFFRERFKDLHDISRRIMGYLRKSVRFSLADIPTGSIIFASEFTPSDIAEASYIYVSALVAESGGATSHAAIVAKAKGIPFIANVNFEGIEIDREAMVIVDGRTGDIIFNPSAQTLAKYRQIGDHLSLHIARLGQMGQLDAETFDGYKIRLSANIDMLSQADMLHQYGGQGVGLFRSEHFFLSNDTFPSEEEQFDIYRSVVEKMQGLPIVIRTFDIGAERRESHTKQPPESNPYLGCRAIRFLLKEKGIFTTQLRAILRAASYGDVSLMFPMVASLSELIEAKALVRQVERELESQGLIKSKPIRLGCMIEVPSAAIISDLLAKECDFLSIGTNDLVQYVLAVDRDNHTLSHLYTPTHPGVIRLIKLIVAEANYYGIPVTLCGEVAADPRYTPLLLGLGIRELSVTPRYLPVIKHAIRNTSIVAASHLAEQVMRLSLAAEIEELLNHEYKHNVPEDCFYNCDVGNTEP